MARRTIGATLVAVAIVAAAPALAAADPLRVRKDAAVLTAKEKQRLVAALHALKTADYPGDADPNGISWYDQFVQWHVDLSHCGETGLDSPGVWGHGGPMFLPWHRQYLLLLEDALREVSGKHITLPYWDWTREASTNAVLADDLMGKTGNAEHGYRLESGPFSYDKWRLYVNNDAATVFRATSTTHITRNIGSPVAPSLPPKADVDFALGRPVYDTAPWDERSDARKSFRMALEGIKNNHNPLTDGDNVGIKGCAPDGWRGQGSLFGDGTLHNLVHVYVGGVTGVTEDGVTLLGTMTVPLASPNDPIFFLHHANVDRIWALWQQTHPDDPYRPLDGQGLVEGDEIDDRMHPFPETPADVADVERLGYTYAAPGATNAKVRRRGAAARRSADARLLCRLRRV